MAEIQGKSILVRVSARFELARVRVIGSQLYLIGLFLIVCLTEVTWLLITMFRTLLDGFQEVMVIPSSPPPENDH